MDVTQSCRSSNNSGIQVVTRNLYRVLNSRIKVIPIVWDNFICQYSSLQTNELSNLENPFTKNYKAKLMTKADINAILMELSVLKNDMYHFRQDMERRVSRLERIVISITAFYVISSFGVIFNTIVL